MAGTRQEETLCPGPAFPPLLMSKWPEPLPRTLNLRTRVKSVPRLSPRPAGCTAGCLLLWEGRQGQYLACPSSRQSVDVVDPLTKSWFKFTRQRRNSACQIPRGVRHGVDRPPSSWGAAGPRTTQRGGRRVSGLGAGGRTAACTARKGPVCPDVEGVSAPLGFGLSCASETRLTHCAALGWRPGAARGGLGRPAAPHGAAARWEGCAVGTGPDPAGRPRPGCSEAAAQGVPRGRCLAERSPTRSPGGADTEALSSRSCLCPATGHRARPSLRPLVPARAGLAGPLRAEEGGARAAGAAPPGLPSPPACGGTDPKPNRRKPGLPGTGWALRAAAGSQAGLRVGTAAARGQAREAPVRPARSAAPARRTAPRALGAPSGAAFSLKSKIKQVILLFNNETCQVRQMTGYSCTHHQNV